MSDRAEVWTQIVECAMDEMGVSINVGSKARRAAILWANERVYANADPAVERVVEAAKLFVESYPRMALNNQILHKLDIALTDYDATRKEGQEQ